MHITLTKHQEQHPKRIIISKKAHQDRIMQPQSQRKVADGQSSRLEVIPLESKRPVNKIKSP
jgi:hypothetical protein